MHIRIGMYAVFLQDWLKVFPREQILAIKFEHYAQSRSDVMRDVMTFLGIGMYTFVSYEEAVSEVHFHTINKYHT